MLTVLSLGAGVQSSTMALMCAKGEITPMPDLAIFADTGAEPEGVYKWLDWLEPQLPFPVHRVMHKDGLLEGLNKSLADGKFAVVPFYTESDSKAGGLLRRQCTREYKIAPIQQEMRRLLGLSKGQRAGDEVKVIQYIGISTDEAVRMKPSRDKWVENRWPLIDLNMSRADCLKWMEKNAYPKPAKSACTFCPYHDDALWREMKRDDPKSFAEAVEMDKKIRNGAGENRLYVHRSMKPLDEVDFRNLEDVGQTRLWDDECEGLCGN